MRTNRAVVLDLWCRLTGQETDDLDAAAQAAFFARPQVPELTAAPYPILLESGISAASRGALPLDRWLDDLRALRSREDHPSARTRTSA
jgi:hypothetical protein